MPDEARTLTHEQLRAEAAARFGPDPMGWAFQCPACGDVATLRDFRASGGNPNRAGQECIGRLLGSGPAEHGKPAQGVRGCDWAAYGLIPGPWAVTIPASYGRPATTLRAFPLAPAPVSSRAAVS